MSEIITDKLTGKTSAGDVTITSEGGSATMQLQQGLAKAWCCLTSTTNGGSGTVSLLDSHNLSSFTDRATGDYTNNFSNNFSAAQYCTSGSCKDDQYHFNVAHDIDITTSACAYGYYYQPSGTSDGDYKFSSSMHLGDLA